VSVVPRNDNATLRRLPVKYLGTLGDFICKVAQLEGQLDTAQQKLRLDADLFSF
jgi:hypothetical protein